MANEGKKEKQVKAVRHIRALHDLDTLRITLEWERPDGEWVAVSGTPLSYTRWVQIGEEIKDPSPPIMGVDKDGRPVYDRNDRDYLAALSAAATRRQYARLIAFLDIDMPGDTLDEQIAALEERLSAGEVNALARQLSKIFSGEEARIGGRAETFRDDGPDAASDDVAPRVENAR